MSSVVTINIILLWLLNILNLVLILAVIRRVNSSEPTSPFTPPAMEGGLEIGTEAPNFTGIDLEGKEISKETFQNTPLSLIFIAPDCQPCREYLPVLETLKPLAKRLGVQFYLVSLGELEATKSLINELNISIPTIVTQGNINFQKDFQVMYTPSFYLIDKEGKVAASGAPDAQTLSSVWSKFSSLA